MSTSVNEGEQQKQFLKQMGTSSVKEVQRVTSPDGLVDAVLCLKATNATVATPTEVYLVEKSGEVSGEPIFRADRVEDITVTWPSGSKLKISAKQARTFVTAANVDVDLGDKKHTVDVEFAILERL